MNNKEYPLWQKQNKNSTNNHKKGQHNNTIIKPLPVIATIPKAKHNPKTNCIIPSQMQFKPRLQRPTQQKLYNYSVNDSRSHRYKGEHIKNIHIINKSMIVEAIIANANTENKYYRINENRSHHYKSQHNQIFNKNYHH